MSLYYEDGYEFTDDRKCDECRFMRLFVSGYNCQSDDNPDDSIGRQKTGCPYWERALRESEVTEQQRKAYTKVVCDPEPRWIL